MSLLTFTKYFPDEQSCIDFLAVQKWGDIHKATCPHCKNNKTYRFTNGKRYSCSHCKKQFSVRYGTIFEGSNLSLLKWFMAIYLFTSLKKGISSVQLSKYIEVTQKTAWFMLQRIRYSMEQTGNLYAGITEIDEAYLGGSEANRHMKDRVKGIKPKTVVVGMVNRDTKTVRSIKVDSAKYHDLADPIMNNIETGSTIITDEFQAYKTLGKYFYNQKTVNHSQGEYVKKDNREAFKIHTNTIEGYWSLLKRGINGIYHWCSKKHTNKYLDEYSFRYNHRDLNDYNRFTFYFSICNKPKLSYKTLIA